SQGRVLFGIGGGWDRDQCAILGGGFDHRWTQIKESIAAMKVLWRDCASVFRGNYVSLPPVRCYPKHARTPHPPVLIGSIGNPRARARVAEWGDGWIPIVSSLDEYAAGVSQIRALADRMKRDFDDLDFTVFGMEGQWRTPADARQLDRAGVGRALI